MNRLKTLVISSALLLTGMSVYAQDQQPPDPEEFISSQLENFEKMFKMDDVELFYVDSVLRANIPPMLEELESLRRGGAANQETYMFASDKWMDSIDKGLEKVLSAENWERYMKSMYGREKIKRDKRIAKRQNNK